MSPFRFSIIVPFFGNLTDFEDTLASVLRHQPPKTQVIAVHDGAYRDPYDLGDEITLVPTSSTANLPQYLNVGMCYAESDITVLVRPGIEIDENWQEPIAQAFASPTVAMATPILVEAATPNTLLAAGIGVDRSFSRRVVGLGKPTRWSHSRRCAALGPTSWLAAYRTPVLKALGPIDENLDSVFLDADIALSMRQLGLKNVMLPDFVGTVDSDVGFRREIEVPHGLSAERATRRFDRPSWGKATANRLWDLVQAPTATWRIQHLWQRSAARALKSDDLAFARHLRLLKPEQWQPRENQTDNVAALDSSIVSRRRAA